MGTPSCRVLGTGHFLPDGVRTNADLMRMLDTSDEWIRTRTGIRERRIAPAEQATSDLAVEAAKRALDAAGIKSSDLDLIIVGTVTPDHPMPACAATVQRKLGASCPAFDLSAACAGFVFGMVLGEQFIQSGKSKYVLVIGAEVLSRIIDWTDRTTSVLFGDGAGAVVLGPAGGAQAKSRARGLRASHLDTDGTLADSLLIPEGGSAVPITEEGVRARKNKVAMRGQDIFKAAVRNLCSSSEASLRDAELSVSELDWICPHQANVRILDAVGDRLDAPAEKVLKNIERVGNTSSASIPILFDENVRAGRIVPGDHVLFCSLGAGVSWGSVVLTY